MCQVDPSDGAVCLEDEDFTLAGDYPLIFSRRYYNHSNSVGVLGLGWTHRYGHRLEQRDGSLVLFDDQGKLIPLGPVPADGEPHPVAPGIVIRRSGQDFYVYLHGKRRLTFTFVDQTTALPVRWDETDGDTLWLRYTSSFLTEISAGSGHALAFEYNMSRKLARVTDERRRVRVAEFTYQGDLLVAATDVDGRSKVYQYKDNLLVEHSNRNGGTTFLDYDSKGRCTATWRSDLTHHWTYRYLDEPRLTLVTNPFDDTSALFFNENGLLTRTELPDGSIVTRSYNGSDQPISTESPTGSSPVTVVAGNQEIVVDPNGAATVTKRDAYGRVVEEADEIGGVESYQFDDACRITRYQASTGWETEFDYDDAGRLVRMTTPLGNVFRAERTGNRLQVLDSLGLVYTSEGDPVSRRFRWSSGREIKAAYDPHGRISTMDAGDGRVSTRSYDAEGFLVARTDNDGAPESYDRDSFGAVLAWRHATGREIQYVYDAGGRLESVRSSGGRTVQFRRDSRGRVVEAKFRDGRTEQTQYDLAGNKQITIRGAAIHTEYSYDADGFPLTVASGSETLRYKYDPAGNCVEARSSDHIVELKYLPGDLLTGETQDGHRVSYEYNSTELVSRISLDERRVTICEYNVRGQLTRLSDTLFGVHTFEYDAFGRRTVHRLPNGIERRFEYNTQDRIAEVSILGALDAGATRRAYTYTRRGDMARETRADQTVDYMYDSGARLTSANRNGTPEETFAYDIEDNIIRDRHGTHVLEGDRLTAIGNEAFSYDDGGRIVERTSGGHSTRYEYHLRGLLSSVADATGEIRFTYDGMGRRVTKTTREGHTRFIWERDRLIAEIRKLQDREVRVDYLYEPNTFVPLGHAVDGMVFHYDTDQRMTIRGVYDSSSRLVAEYDYSAFGVRSTKALLEPMADTNFRLAGQYADAETGLHYNRYRYFDPRIARFIAPDPYTTDIRENPYAYGPNPITWIDPFGLMPAFNAADNELWVEEAKVDGFYVCANCGFKNKNRTFAVAESGRPVGDGSFHGDHITPNADGGEATKENHQVLGGTCNCSKGRGRPIGMT